MDVLRENQRKVVEYLTLCVFFPRGRKKNRLKECSLDKVEVCQLYELNHETKECPSLPEVKEVLQESTPDLEQAYFISQKNPWQPRNQGMNPNSLPFWNNMNNMNTQFPSHYSNHQWLPSQPFMQNSSSWTPWSQQTNNQTSWSPS